MTNEDGDGDYVLKKVAFGLGMMKKTCMMRVCHHGETTFCCYAVSTVKRLSHGFSIRVKWHLVGDGRWGWSLKRALNVTTSCSLWMSLRHI